MKKYQNFMAAVAGLAAISLAAGCQEQTGTETAAPTTPAATAAAEHGHEHAEGEGEHGHGHGAGPHDGTLADWGGGKYHVEFTVDHEQQEATVYILGSDEKSPAPIKTDKVLLSIGKIRRICSRSTCQPSLYAGTRKSLASCRNMRER